MARPRINPDKHRKNVAITLEPDLLLRSRALAAAQGKPLSQLLEELLRRWLDDQDATDEEVEGAIDAFIEGHERQEAVRDKKKAAKKTAKKKAAKQSRK